MNIAITTAPAERARISSKWLVVSVFLAPSVLLLAIFLGYPLLSSLRLSLVDWTGLGTHSRYVGLDNWVHLAQDAVFWRSLWNNVLLEKAGRGSRILKILYFLPLLMSSVAIGVLFKNVYDPNFGPLNVALHALGLDSFAQDWLGDTRFSLASTIAVIVWQNVPFYMILFMAGLSSMPAEVNEAAVLDGASQWTIFWRIKLPHLQGAIRTAVLLSVLGSLRYFDLIYVMTGGGPEGSSELMATYMYRTVFSSFQLGYGSTIGSAMFIIVSLVAALALRITRRYETEV